MVPRGTTGLFRGDPPRIAWVVNLRTQWAAGLRSLPDSPLAALPLAGLVRVLGGDCLQASWRVSPSGCLGAQRDIGAGVTTRRLT